jgi:DNA polymerase III delta prime subunit
MSAPVDQERAVELSIEASRVFTPSAPINDRALFAGRLPQIEQVMDAVNQRGRHAIIFGERGVGKTSLSNVLATFLRGGNIVSRRIGCDAGDSYDSVWKKMFMEFQFQQVAEIGGFGKPSLPPRADAADDIISPDVVRRQLVLWSQNSHPILIIDEFDRIDDRYRTIFADTIKTLSDSSVNVTVLFVGVAESVDELISEHQSIERALAQIKMPRMSEEEIKEIITTGATRLGMSIDGDSLSRIAQLSQGLPHYAHLLGLYASRTALAMLSLEIGSDVLSSAITSALQGIQQSIRSAWQKATLSARKDNLFADVLLSCALAQMDELGTFASQDVRLPMRMVTGKPYDIPAFAQHLNEFSEPKRGNILKKIGGSRRFRYHFTNPLMPPYLIMRGFAEGKVSAALLDQLS